MASIDPLNRKRVPKRCAGHLERNAVVALVIDSLNVIPFEVIIPHYILVTISWSIVHKLV